MKIIRTKTEAKGGVTKEELELLKKHSEKWIKIAYRTDPINKEKITAAIEGLYEVAGLKKPRVVIVPSPKIMAFAGAPAAAWWAKRGAEIAEAATEAAAWAATLVAIWAATERATLAATERATLAATERATLAATERATLAATERATLAATERATLDAIWAATWAATERATLDATDSATLDATSRALRDATEAAIGNENEALAALAEQFLGSAKHTLKTPLLKWREAYQGGNMWAPRDCYLTSWRDVMGLDLPIYEKYKYWEEAAKEGGFRYVHAEFCMVSDFPLYIRTNKDKQPHCDGAPSHEWRDGWKLWHLNGVAVDQWMAETPSDKLDAKEILKIENVDQRREVLRRLGVANMVKQLGGKVIDKDYTTLSKYELLELDIGLEEPCKYLKMNNPSIEAVHVEGVPNECMTVQEAINWRRYGNKSLEWRPSQLT